MRSNQNSSRSDAESLADFAGSLVLFGAGKMGSALLEGWLRLGLDPQQIAVVDPQPSGTVSKMGVALNPSRPAQPATVLVIAVKPQVAAEVMPQAAGLAESALVISVMAGKTIGFLETGLSPKAAIVRAMPNTPASVGRGVTVAVPNARVDRGQRALAQRLLAAVGRVEWIDDEALMDAVTAVSGSGPAYVFLLAESLAKAGVAAGLPPDLAARLARATVAGSGELLHRSDLDAATLRENVTSPGGTTAAALAILMAATGLDPLLREAVLAAARRSRELATL